MAKHYDLSGWRFEKWKVLYRTENHVSPCGSVKAQYLCRCDCGTISKVLSSNLTSGKSTNCGCVRKSTLPASVITHGDTVQRKSTRLYTVHRNMINRCTKPESTYYHRYGGRGITVCNEWLNSYENFKDWALLNGYAENLTIDRIDNNKGYYPENCQWVSNKNNCNNTSQNRHISYNGVTKTLSEWADYLGIKYGTLESRIRRGWSIEKAFTTPI